jgi:L-serine dehydratase
MNLLDIVGPVMVGPSSSHTAGAVKIGLISKKLLGEDVAEAKIYMHGSFAATGKGHGTDRALVAGLYGMPVDDDRIPHSFDVATEAGMKFSFENVDIPEAHPNTVKMQLTGVSGKTLEIVGVSTGGGRMKIAEIDGLKTSFEGDYPTLIVHNHDEPGRVLGVTSMLAHRSINISTMQLFRDTRGGYAVMVIECDNEVSDDSIEWLRKQDGIIKVTYLSQER